MGSVEMQTFQRKYMHIAIFHMVPIFFILFTIIIYFSPIPFLRAKRPVIPTLKWPNIHHFAFISVKAFNYKIFTGIFL